MGSRARSSVRRPVRQAPRPGPRRSPWPRPAPRRRPTSHTASSAPSSVARTSLSSSTDVAALERAAVLDLAPDRRPTPGGARTSSSSTASKRPRVVHVVEHVEVAVAQRPRSRRRAGLGTARGAGGRCTRRPAPPTRRRRSRKSSSSGSGRPPARSMNTHSRGRFGERAAVTGGDRASGARPSAARSRCRTSPARPSSWYTGQRPHLEVSSSARPRRPRARTSPASSASSVATSCRNRASASSRSWRRWRRRRRGARGATRGTRGRAGDGPRTRPRTRAPCVARCSVRPVDVPLSSGRVHGCAETSDGSVSAMGAGRRGRTVSGFLDRLGRRAVRHRWWFIGVWIVAAVAIVALAAPLDGQISDNFRIPGRAVAGGARPARAGLPRAAGDNALGRVRDARRHHEPVGRSRRSGERRRTSGRSRTSRR